MDPVYRQIREHSRLLIACFPAPAFYLDHENACRLSRHLYSKEPIIRQLYDFIAKNIDNDFGHGLDHARKVTLDAGALMVVEGERAGLSEPIIREQVRRVQCAGLLHDIARKEKHHAVAGAEMAREVLVSHHLPAEEVDDVCRAIRDHEAFQPREPIESVLGTLVANCLYDADKFRWGPDNFDDTVWDMVTYFDIPLPEFIERYPRGMERLREIGDTFRTRTGQNYGREFIAIGLAVGEQLLDYIRREFGHFL